MTRSRLTPLLAACLAGAALSARAEVRPGTFHSAAVAADVNYVVDLPPSYDSSPGKRYPVVYVLHGLFEGPGFWEHRGLAALLADLRAKGSLAEFLVVAAAGGNSFFVNGHTGNYQDLVTKDLIAHVESTYRVTAGRKGRGLLGVSMGGYAALRIAFQQPDLFAAVATHSAMLLDRVPTAEEGARRGQMAAFHAVFGDPVDPALWARNDPLAAARQADRNTAPALYFDCGSEDRFGLAGGNKELHRILEERRVPHTFELGPGDHGYEFVRSRLATSLSFLGRQLE